MRQSIPPVPMRAQIVDARGMPTRAILDFLQALRLSIGGDAAMVAPAEQASVLAPVPCSSMNVDAFAPVPVSGADSELLPVSVGSESSGLDPVGDVVASDGSLEPI